MRLVGQKHHKTRNLGNKMNKHNILGQKKGKAVALEMLGAGIHGLGEIYSHGNEVVKDVRGRLEK